MSVSPATPAQTTGIFVADKVLRAPPADARTQYDAYLGELATSGGRAAFHERLAEFPAVLATLSLDQQVRRALGYVKVQGITDTHFKNPQTELALLRAVFAQPELVRALASKGTTADRANVSGTGISDHGFHYDAHGEVVVVLRLFLCQTPQFGDDFIAGATVRFDVDNQVKSRTLFLTDDAFRHAADGLTREAP